MLTMLAVVIAIVAGVSRGSILAAIGGFVMTYVIAFLLIALGIEVVLN